MQKLQKRTHVADEAQGSAALRWGWVYHVSIKIMLVTLACAMLLTALCSTALLLAGSEYGLLTMNRTDFRHSLYDAVAWRQVNSRYGCYTALHALEQLSEEAVADFAYAMKANEPADLYLRVRTATPQGEQVLFDNTPADLAADFTVSRSFVVHYYAEPDGSTTGVSSHGTKTSSSDFARPHTGMSSPSSSNCWMAAVSCGLPPSTTSRSGRLPKRSSAMRSGL
jgi:hypothetical protein